MGFRLSDKTFRLVFEDGSELHGAQITCRGVSLGTYLEVVNPPDGQDETEMLLTAFAEKVLVSWDLENEQGFAIPPNAEGLRSIELRAALHIVETWVSYMTSPPAPLGAKSQNGERFTELAALTSPVPGSPLD